MAEIKEDEFLDLLDNEGYLNEAGQDKLVRFMDRLRPERWGKAFIPLKKMGVHCAIELVIIRKGEVLLTWRDDKFFTGWHTPGTYLEQEETWQDAAQRCANREIKAKVDMIRVLDTHNHPGSPRFHNVSVLLLCSIVGEPQTGQWFSECPADLIPVHQKYWPAIESALKRSREVHEKSAMGMAMNDMASFGLKPDEVRWEDYL